jgi:hypothetical protein
MNDELLLKTLQEIREDQKKIVEDLSSIKTELMVSRNGYEPFEILNFYNWVDEQMKKQEQQVTAIKKAIITWGVPLLLSAVIVGLIQTIK